MAAMVSDRTATALVSSVTERCSLVRWSCIGQYKGTIRLCPADYDIDIDRTTRNTHEFLIKGKDLLVKY